MTKKYGQFKDLLALGYVHNRMQEYRNRSRGAPPQEYGPNSLVWDLEAYRQWIESRPRRIPGQTIPGAANSLHKFRAKSARAAARAKEAAAP
jgi:hypothetical protein